MRKRSQTKVLFGLLGVLAIAGCSKENPIGSLVGPKGPAATTDSDTSAIVPGGDQQPLSEVPTGMKDLCQAVSVLPDPSNAGAGGIITLSVEETERLLSALAPPVGKLGDSSRYPQIASWAITNQRILDRAYRDIDRYVGLECKPWVRKVVLDATGVVVPSTAGGGSGWYWNYSPDVVSWCGYVEYASPGQILQMWLGAWNPHTAIIVGKSSTGMYWIDSNWNRDLTVRLHWISYSYFYSRTGGYFTINQINR